MENFLDTIFGKIVNVILSIFKVIIDLIFANGFSTFLFYFLFFNGLGFFLMFFDKRVAKKNGEIKAENADLPEKDLKRLLARRISENTLILIAVIGGSIGILGGMYKFHHKTQKAQFKIGVPIIIVLQVILIIYVIIRNIISGNVAAV